MTAFICAIIGAVGGSLTSMLLIRWCYKLDKRLEQTQGEINFLKSTWAQNEMNHHRVLTMREQFETLDKHFDMHLVEFHHERVIPEPETRPTSFERVLNDGDFNDHDH